jgi:hypothetical protein
VMEQKTTRAIHTHGPRPTDLPWLSEKAWAALSGIGAAVCPTLTVDTYDNRVVVIVGGTRGDSKLSVDGIELRGEASDAAMFDSYASTVARGVGAVTTEPVSTVASRDLETTDEPKSTASPARMPTRKRRGA